MSSNRLSRLFLITSAALASSSASAVTSLSYEGQLLKPGGVPVSGMTTEFKFQIQAPGDTCILYEEKQTRNLSTTAGNFALSIGIGGLVESFPGMMVDGQPGAATLSRALMNRGTFTGLTNCSGATTYTPNPTDERKLVVLFKDETMAGWETLPAQLVTHAPYAVEALEAQKLAGQAVDRFLRVSDPGAVMTPLSNAEYAKLTDLIAGTSTMYAKNGVGGGTQVYSATSQPSVLVAGTVWFDTGSNQLKVSNGTAFNAVASGGGGTVTSIATGAGLTGGPITASGTISIAPGGVGPTELSTDAVTSSKIADGTIATADLGSGAVTFNKIQNITSGKLAGRSTAGAGLLEELSVGTGLSLSGGTLTATVTDTDTFAPVTAACANTFVPYKSGAAWTCLQAASSTTSNTLVTRDAAGSIAVNVVTTNGLTLKNAGSLLNIFNPVGGAWNMTLPATAGFSNQVLTTDGTGTLSWTTPSSGSQWVTQAPGINYMGGSVGIGTTSPRVRLDVTGTLRLGDGGEVCDSNTAGSLKSSAGMINVCDGVSWSPVAASSNPQFYGNSSSVYQSSSGIATVPSAAAIRVGNTAAVDGAASILQLTARNSATTSQSAFLGVASKPGGAAPVIVIGQQVGANNYQERVRISEYGNVGIGSTSPAYNDKLHVFSNDVPNAAVRITNAEPSTTATAQLILENYGGKSASVQLSSPTAGNILKIESPPTGDYPIVFATNGSEKLRVGLGGNVGIGTTAPAFKLDVAGAVNATSLKVNGVDVNPGPQTCLTSATSTSGPLQAVTGCSAILAGAVVNCSPAVANTPGTAWGAYSASNGAVALQFASTPTNAVSQWRCMFMNP